MPRHSKSSVNMKERINNLYFIYLASLVFEGCTILMFLLLHELLPNLFRTYIKMYIKHVAFILSKNFEMLILTTTKMATGLTHTFSTDENHFFPNYKVIWNDINILLECLFPHVRAVF